MRRTTILFFIYKTHINFDDLINHIFIKGSDLDCMKCYVVSIAYVSLCWFQPLAFHVFRIYLSYLPLFFCNKVELFYSFSLLTWILQISERFRVEKILKSVLELITLNYCQFHVVYSLSSPKTFHLRVFYDAQIPHDCGLLFKHAR